MLNFKKRSDMKHELEFNFFKSSRVEASPVTKVSKKKITFAIMSCILLSLFVTQILIDAHDSIVLNHEIFNEVYLEDSATSDNSSLKNIENLMHLQSDAQGHFFMNDFELIKASMKLEVSNPNYSTQSQLQNLLNKEYVSQPLKLTVAKQTQKMIKNAIKMQKEVFTKKMNERSFLSFSRLKSIDNYEYVLNEALKSKYGKDWIESENIITGIAANTQTPDAKKIEDMSGKEFVQLVQQSK